MAKRVLLGLLVLWCCWGVWRLVSGEPESIESGLAEEAGDEWGSGMGEETVELEAVGAKPPAPTPGHAAPAHVSRGLPDWLNGEAALTESAIRDRFLAWLKEDPRRILDLLYLGLESPPIESRTAEGLYRDAAERLGGDTSDFGFLVPTLLRELEASRESWKHMAALLGALSRMGPAMDEKARDAVVMLAAQADTHQEVRVLAVLAGLNYPGLSNRRVAAMAAGIGAAGTARRQTQQRLVKRLGAMGPDARVFLPSLLALHDSVIRSWWVHEPVLRALQSIAPDDPRVFAAMVRALGSNGTHRRFARETIVAAGEEGRRRLIGFLETAPGRARVEGVGFLLEEGVPGSEIGHLILPALTDANARVRSRAVALLPRAGQRTDVVLPRIETLFASDAPDRWLTATQALGALSRLPGDRGPIVNLLFTAVRMPDERVRVIAVQTLLMYDGENERILPLLADLLDDSEASVRREAVDGLGELSAHDENARGHLQAALGDADESVREVARYWLKEGEEEGDVDDD